jgi:hypothetical protein
MTGDMAAPGDDLIGGEPDVIEPPRDDQDDDEDGDAGAALGRERR